MTTPTIPAPSAEDVARAMRNAVIRDDEGEFPSLFDMLGYSGENKSHTVVNGLAREALALFAPLIAERDAVAVERDAWKLAAFEYGLYRSDSEISTPAEWKSAQAGAATALLDDFSRSRAAVAALTAERDRLAAQLARAVEALRAEEEARHLCRACDEQLAGSQGASLIARERARQVSREGWTPEHDDAHENGDLQLAAACYLFATQEAPPQWPWERSFWKPSDPVRNLQKAGALIAAEIDRILRAEVLREHEDLPHPGSEEEAADYHADCEMFKRLGWLEPEEAKTLRDDRDSWRKKAYEILDTQLKLLTAEHEIEKLQRRLEASDLLAALHKENHDLLAEAYAALAGTDEERKRSLLRKLRPKFEDPDEDREDPKIVGYP